MNKPERISAKQILEYVRNGKPVVAKHRDGNFTNIGLTLAGKMQGHSYIVNESLYEIIVDMGSCRKESD